jgi:hypothetical protein
MTAISVHQKRCGTSPSKISSLVWSSLGPLEDSFFLEDVRSLDVCHLLQEDSTVPSSNIYKINSCDISFRNSDLTKHSVT